MKGIIMNLSDYNSCHLCPRSCGIDPPGFFWFLWLWRYHKSRQSRSALLGRALYQRHPRQRNDLFLRLYLKMLLLSELSHQSAGIRKRADHSTVGGRFPKPSGQGAHNINLVTATQYLPSVIAALDLVKHKLVIPVVYNCGGYEQVGDRPGAGRLCGYLASGSK